MALRSANVVDYFQTPPDPEGYTQDFPRSSLRVIDYSALEYDTLQRAVIEYVKTYHRDEFSDFMASNGFMMLTELVCYIGSVLSQRSDILVNESFLPTSFTRNAVINHMALIGQSMRRQTPATVQVMCTVDSPVATDIRIKTNGDTSFQVSGPDGQPITYEIFSAPYDWDSDIVIPAKKYGVVAWGIEGRFASTVNVVSAGGNNQEVDVVDEDIIDEPILVNVDNVPWTRVDFIEDYGPTDTVYSVRFEEGKAVVKFGDNDSGAAPVAGQTISIRYRVGGGVRGRIGVNAINQTRAYQPDFPATAVTPVRFRNLIASSGGYDHETIDQAKERAPKTWATHDFIATSTDYATAATFFQHPVYGSVLKAAATVHTSINSNVIRVAVLAEGADGRPATTSKGLKNALTSHLAETNVLTDDVDVVDGKIKNVDIDMNIVVFKNVEASVVKGEVNAALEEFFDVKNWEMGQPLYVSDLYERITAINGIRYVDIFDPADDILPRQHLEPEKIENYEDYQNAKDCMTGASSPYNLRFDDKLDWTFTLEVLTPGVRIEDVIVWALYNCDLYIACSDCSGSNTTYEFRTYQYVDKYVVDWDELIVMGNKDIRIYYEK